MNNLDDVKFIYLVRDGRDVALSMLKSESQGKSIFLNANRWKTEQEEMLRLMGSISKDQIALVKYEDFLQNPKKVLRNLCSYLNIEFEQNMLEIHDKQKAKDASRNSKYWKNLSNPLMRSNYNKFINQMSLRDIWIFESIAGGQLDQLNYKRGVQDDKLKIPLYLQLYYWAKNLLLLKIKKRDYLSEPNRKREKH